MAITLNNHHPRRSARLANTINVDYNIDTPSRNSLKRSADDDDDTGLSPCRQRRARSTSPLSSNPASEEENSGESDVSIGIEADDGEVDNDHHEGYEEDEEDTEQNEQQGENEEEEQTEDESYDEDDDEDSDDDEEDVFDEEGNYFNPNQELRNTTWHNQYPPMDAERAWAEDIPYADWHGQHCPHPVNIFFHDSRARRPRPRSRRRILREIVWNPDLPMELKQFWTRYYRPGGRRSRDLEDPDPDPDILSRLLTLPTELRLRILKFTSEEAELNRGRLVLLDRARYPTLRWQMPAPALANTSRRLRDDLLFEEELPEDGEIPEARRRQGQYVLYRARSRDVQRDIGFLHQDDIIVTWRRHWHDFRLYYDDYDLYCDAQEEQGENPAEVLGQHERVGEDSDASRARRRFHCKEVIRDLRTHTIVLIANDFMYHPWERKWDDAVEPVPPILWMTERWAWLLEVPSVQVIYISWSDSQHTETRIYGRNVSLRVRDSAPEELTKLTTTPLVTMVDLYDDQRLAEIDSLETEMSRCRTPHYRGNRTCRPRMCVNCERIDWEQIWEWRFRCFYVILRYQHEHLGADMNPILNDDGTLNREHPFVVETLRIMPTLRPCVMFNLVPRKKGEPDWNDLCAEVMNQPLLSRMAPPFSPLNNDFRRTPTPSPEPELEELVNVFVPSPTPLEDDPAFEALSPTSPPRSPAGDPNWSD